MLIDTHCHLDDEKFSDKESVISNGENNGVKIMVSMGTNISSSIINRDLSEKFSSVFFAAGIHPSDVSINYKTELFEIEKLLDHKKCVAVGEIGLDYYWTTENKELQKSVFIEQIRLANAYKLPFSVHSRDATFDMLEIIKENGRFIESGAVMHCFSGSYETAKILIDKGFYLGFGGTLTFKNSVNLKAVCEKVPIDFMVTETDSPYLSPEPERGKINTPANILYVAKKIAEIKGIDEAEVRCVLERNAKNLFKKISI